MSNVISLSSSPAVAGPHGSLSLGRSSSPDLPTLEELVSQENSMACPTRSHTRDARLKPVEGGQPCGKEEGRTIISLDEVHQPDDAADASLIEISPANVTTAPPPKTTWSKNAAAGEKASRTRNSGSASAMAASENVPPQENAEDTTAPKPPKPRRKQTGAVSRHFKPQPEPALPKKLAENVDEPLNIETALSRRLDWTPPPKDTVKEFGSRSSDVIELLSSASKAEGVAKSKEIFQSLKETYGYELEDEPFPTSKRQSSEAPFKKRKQIEMVSTSNGANAMAPPPPPEKSPTKQKAPKKARTITGLATAAYKQAEPELPPPGPADPPAPKPAPATAPGKPKAKTKKRKPKAPKKKEEPHMVLYSPEAALKQVAQQDFVFGTSSQLAREQDAEAANVPKLKDSMPVIEEEEYVTPINSDAIEPPEVQPKLWNAAARDADGELLHPEVIDLVKDSPVGEAPSYDSDPFGYVNPEKVSQRASNMTTGISSSAPKSTQHTDLRPALKPMSQGVSNKQSEPAPSAVHDPLLGVMSSTSPPPSSQKRLSSIYEAGSHPAQSAPQPSPSRAKSAGYTAPEKPRFELYTDAQLARQVAAYGFKPIKKRADMISLLDECWTSKYQGQGARAYSTVSAAGVAEGPAGADGAGEVATQPAAEPAKRPRGRPRKNSAGAATARRSPEAAASTSVTEKRSRGRPRKTAEAPSAASAKPVAKPAPSTPRRKTHVLEIPDSDASSPSTSASSVFSSPPAGHDVSLDDSLALAPTTEESSLHDAITRAITSAPRSEDPANPSWHERILMYESVIVEDLAAWLNTGALDRVGFDGEVSALEVKRWCEAKSVCCVWRTRMGGEERKRL